MWRNKEQKKETERRKERKERRGKNLRRDRINTSVVPLLILTPHGHTERANLDPVLISEQLR